MKITAKIKKSHDDVMADAKNPNRFEINQIGNLAADAIFNGINSIEWKAYMKKYASNKAQLARLCGEDASFTFNLDPQKRQENKRILAYLLGNGICTTNTRKKSPDANTNVVSDASGTLNYLTPEMRARLDSGVDNVTDPNF